MSKKPTEYGMIFRFDDQSSSFVHGFELGQLWTKLEQRIDPTNVYHSSNAETIIRACQHHGCRVKIKACEYGGEMCDDWIDLTFIEWLPKEENKL